MALNPKQVISSLTVSEQCTLVQLEKVIDNELPRWKKEIKNNSPILIKIGTNISESTQELIIQKYEDNGWRVSVVEARNSKCFKFQKQTNTFLDKIKNAVQSILQQ